MATIPTAGCCDPCTCTDTTYVQVPGAAGAAGAAGAGGAAGTNGESAWTETTALFVMPAVGVSVAGVFVDSTAFMFVGQIVQVEGAGGMEVTAVNSGTSCDLENLGWAANAAPGANIASGAMVVPSGPEGDAGAAGAPTDATYWCRTADGTLTNESNMSALATGFVKVTTGTGVPSSVTTVQAATELTGAVPIANGGTGQTTANPAFNALAPTTTRGDIIFRNATVNARLGAGAANTTLHANGAGTDPTWELIDLTTDVTGVLPAANGGSGILLQRDYAVVSAAADYITAATIGVAIPQYGDGTVALALAFTPTVATSTVRVEAHIPYRVVTAATPNLAKIVAHLHINAALNAVATVAANMLSAGKVDEIELVYEYAPGSTAAILFEVVVGVTTGDLIRIPPDYFVGAIQSYITVSEYA